MQWRTPVASPAKGQSGQIGFHNHALVPVHHGFDAVLLNAPLVRHRANDLEDAKGLETKVAGDEFDGLSGREFMNVRHRGLSVICSGLIKP
jgi:hypothetical protein